ncbi:MAG: hypothetical protein N3B21_08465 [Clostridia bacterium]|nr:hypothetical protein [Clostridia bacterium]
MFNQFYNYGQNPPCQCNNPYDQRDAYEDQPIRYPGWDMIGYEERQEIARDLWEEGLIVDQNGYVYEEQGFYSDEQRVTNRRCIQRCRERYSDDIKSCLKIKNRRLQSICIKEAERAFRRCRRRCRR